MFRHSFNLLTKVNKLHSISKSSQSFTNLNHTVTRGKYQPLLARLYSSTSIRNDDDDDKKKSQVPQKPSMKDKFKKLWKQYGMIAVGTYFTIYASTLGGLFLAVDYDILNAASVGLDPVMAIDKVSRFICTRIAQSNDVFMFLCFGR